MISKKIKMAMMDKGITASELSGELQIARQSLYNSLHRGNFTSSNLEKIAAVLDCDLVLQDRKTGKIY